MCFLSVVQLGQGFAARELSPVEVTEALLARITARDRVLHSYITVCADLARAAAAASERRHISRSALGPLDGIPIGVKDLFDTDGIRTTANSRQYAERIPRQDSEAIRRLRRAGAVLLGKHTMYEFASGTPALDALSPPALNPWDLELVPGGSSSGSAAAVAAGLCAAALGSDTGGSIRGPASYCGVVGLKPSSGLVSRRGVIPLSWTLDVVGPMTRSVEDASLMLQAIAGYDSADPASVRVRATKYERVLREDLRGVRIGAPRRVIEAAPDTSAETIAAYDGALSALAELGATVEVVELPEYEHVNAVGQTILVAEAFAFHEERARTRPELYGRNFYQRLLQGAILNASDYIQALRGRALISHAMDSVMRTVDVLAMPTTPHPAWTFEEETETSSWERTSFTRIFNLTGQPAISVSCGFSSRGLPIGLQLAARRNEDALLLSAAHAYEKASTNTGRRPTAIYG